MKKKTIKILMYVVSSYMLFLVLFYALNSDAKFVKWSDLQTGQDWFYFLWLFTLPLVIDFFIIGIPTFYAFSKGLLNNKMYIGSVIILGFILDFFISKSIYGLVTAIYKVGLYLLLFPIFFRVELFYKRLKS